MEKAIINRMKSSSLFNEIDIHFAKFIADYSAIDDEIVPLTAAILSSELANGHICCLLYTSPSPRDVEESRMPSSA